MTLGNRAREVRREDILAFAGIAGRQPWEVVGSLLAARFSCRAFLPKPVPHNDLERLIALSQLSASWCNAQPWGLTITEGKGTERFRNAMFRHATENPSAHEADLAFPSTYSGVYKERRQKTAWQLYDSVGVPWGDRSASRKQSLENFRLFGAPHFMLVTTEKELGTYGMLDCGVFVGNFLLTAQSMGIATIPQAAFAIFSPFVREYFKIPDGRAVVCGISLGYSDLDHPANSFRTRRAPTDEVVTWAAE